MQAFISGQAHEMMKLQDRMPDAEESLKWYKEQVDQYLVGDGEDEEETWTANGWRDSGWVDWNKDPADDSPEAALAAGFTLVANGAPMDSAPLINVAR